MAIVELKRELKLLASDTPAAAYIFNNTILGIRNVSQKTDARKLILALVDSIKTDGHASAAVDGGVSVLAQRFAIAYLRLPNGIVGAATYRASFDEAALAGAHYRDLDSRDAKSPTDPISLEVLRSGGHSCFLDVVETLRQEQQQNGYSEAEFASLVQSLLAALDIRTEAASGRLEQRLARLANIIGRL